jgi:DNA-directed RNA polymerase specialized sigma24 family protein
MAIRREKIKLSLNTSQAENSLNYSQQILIPLFVFQTKLSPFEAIVKYLVEEKQLGFTEIAKKTNRSPKTIWATYQKTREKFSEKFSPKPSEISIPLEVFFKVELSVLESLTVYLSETKKLRITDIARLLGKSKTTIHTTYTRAREKGVTSEKISDEKIVPATIFSQQTGSFEAIVKYLKENRELQYSRIAEILGRNYQTIVTAHKKAIQKKSSISQSPYTKYTINVSKLKDRNLSVLEHISVQLKEQGLNFSEIARLIARDPRTIWTVYNKAVQKSKQNKNASS